MWNKNEVKGKGKQIIGAIRDKAGEVTNDPSLEAEGEAEHLEGKVQETAGKGHRKLGEAVVKVGKVIAGK
ncbi:MAG: CsbD family protein [Blastocatellia bacterium]